MAKLSSLISELLWSIKKDKAPNRESHLLKQVLEKDKD